MTKKARYSFLFAILAAFLLAGCSQDDADSKENETPDRGVEELRFNVNSQQFTRATVINSNTDLQAQDLQIDAYYNGTSTKYLDGAKLHYDSDAWKFWNGSQIHYYWPIEGSVYDPASANITVSSLDFVGYCPYTTPDYITAGPAYSHSAGTVTFTGTIPTETIAGTDYMTSSAQSGKTEFMCAIATGQRQSTNSGTVDMTFKHPFAYIKFQLAASHPYIKINSITLKGLKNEGTCTFNGSSFVWGSLKPADGTVDFKMTLTGDDATFSTNASIQTIGDTYIVIPQSFAGKIEVNAGWTDWGEILDHTVSTTIPSETWVAGHGYTYTFTITESDLKVNVEKYTEQW